MSGGISNSISKTPTETNVVDNTNKKNQINDVNVYLNMKDKINLSNDKIDLHSDFEKLQIAKMENNKELELPRKEGIVSIDGERISHSPMQKDNYSKLRKVAGTLECMHKTLCQNVDNSTTNSKDMRGNMSSESNITTLVAKVWVVKYVDYTSKYGLGFLLNTGCVGVYFNDSTKIVASADGTKFSYIERRCKVIQGSAEHTVENFSMSNYPSELQKKVTLLTHFKNYLCDPKESEHTAGDRNPLSLNHDGEKDNAGTYSLPFLKKWVRTRHAILFRLSTRTVQVVFFDKR